MDGVDRLANLVAIVKGDGLDAAFSEDVHYGGRLSDVENSTFRQYTELLRSLRHSLEDAKLCMAALNNVKARLAKKIRSLQKRCAPLVLEDGIKRIPDEILALIFEAGHQMSDFSEFALRVSYVSRRFRRVSLQTPSLWTRLSSEHPDDQTEALISRSGQLGLHLYLEYDPIDKLRSSLRLLTPHSDRWSSLSLGTGQDDEDIMEEVGLTYFPRLQYVYHAFTIKPESSQWNMPLLSQFYGYCSEFPPISLPFLSQLTCMELYFQDYDTFDMSSLANVLHRMSNLRNLCLEFRGCQIGDTDLMDTWDYPNPHSFHLESLMITFGGPVETRINIDHNFVSSLFQILEYLTASLVDVSMLAPADATDFWCFERFPHGSTIQLQVGPSCSLPIVLCTLLEYCTILHSVQFEMSSFDHDDESYSPWPTWSQFPSFRHLRFHDCCMLEEDRVEELARTLLACEDFESLEFNSCHKISEEFLMDLQDEFGERLKWSL